jgi:hypothetical protein
MTRDYWHIRHFNKKRRALPFAACKSLFSAVGIAKSIGEITIFFKNKKAEPFRFCSHMIV